MQVQKVNTSQSFGSNLLIAIKENHPLYHELKIVEGHLNRVLENDRHNEHLKLCPLENSKWCLEMKINFEDYIEVYTSEPFRLMGGTIKKLAQYINSQCHDLRRLVNKEKIKPYIFFEDFLMKPQVAPEEYYLKVLV